ncbi:hypothetical protein [Croceicoccus mobilis]|uniref:Uncharacterized protein n=1 Tax=Croceicoccus mobilis TaxID=1703339 RepID=A0A916YS00_9SPHN|nr:hypothetical protein [Croceicoccus mobilis]GGD58094.1 hypothetical protein GCM10010990_04260 [Croceicoccus mobilis]
MISLAKALPFGIFLSWILSLFMGNGGTSGGVLAVHLAHVQDYSFYWSWPLFFAGTALATALIAMMDA